PLKWFQPSFGRGRSGGQSQVEVSAALAEFRQELRLRFEPAPVTSLVIRIPMGMAVRHGLRGCDAVQIATAWVVNLRRLRKRSSPVLLISAVAHLNAAPRVEGLRVDDPN